MTALEKILELKKQGKSEKEIISILRSEKYSPLKIEDALSQSKIKEAVTDPNPTEGMNASIMDSSEKENKMEQKQETKEDEKEEDVYSPEAPAPQEAPLPPQQLNYPQNSYPSQGYSNNPSQQPFGQFEQENYTSDYGGAEGYDDYSAEAPAYASSTDTIIEVSEQVFSEKIKPLTKNLKDLLEFKKITEAKLIDFNERLKRMEKNFDKMQLSILDKVSEYGKGLDYLRKEVKMVEDSVSKFS